MSRNRRTEDWRPKTLEKLERVRSIMDAMSDYWPLTLRQIYYQLVAARIITNKPNEYANLSGLLTKARIKGLIPWEAMEDRSRSFLLSAGWSDKSEFVEAEVDGLLTGYRRDLLQSQEIGLEICVEKDALAHIAHGVAFEYTVDVISATGFMSTTFKNDLRNRIMRRAADGKPTKLLYFGDLDPSGWAMLDTIVHTVVEEVGVPAELLLSERVALNPDQVEALDLPISLDPIKGGDSRAKKYVETFGRLAVELDALKPALLEQMVRDAIERNLDLSVFRDEREREAEEKLQLTAIRDDIDEFLEELGLA